MYKLPYLAVFVHSMLTFTLCIYKAAIKSDHNLRICHKVSILATLISCTHAVLHALGTHKITCVTINFSLGTPTPEKKMSHLLIQNMLWVKHLSRYEVFNSYIFNANLPAWMNRML